MCLVTTEFERSSKDGTGLPISSKEALLLAHPMAGVRELIICINTEGVWEKINILISELHVSRLPSITWVGLIHSVDSLHRVKRLASLSKKEFFSSLSVDFIWTTGLPGSLLAGLWTGAAPPALLGLKSANPCCGLGLAGLHKYVSQFLRTYMCTHTIYWFCFSGDA